MPNRTADDPFDSQQLVQVVRPEIAQMILGNIRDKRGVRAIDAESAAQQAASGRFENRDIDVILPENRARSARARPVAASGSASGR